MSKNNNNLPQVTAPEGAKFRTYHVKNSEVINTIIGHITAVTLPGDKEKTKFMCQFSFCSPSDTTKFDRKKGQMYALLRLNSKPIMFDREEGIPIFRTVKKLALMAASGKKVKRSCLRSASA